jgi:hypothetical protein
VVAERKIKETSEGVVARAAVAKTGADATVAVLSPTCAVAQIEQAWWDAVEFSGCEWVACIVPITHTRATQSTHTALTHTPRFADALNTPTPLPLEMLLQTILSLDGDPRKRGARKFTLSTHPPEHGRRAHGCAPTVEHLKRTSPQITAPQ